MAVTIDPRPTVFGDRMIITGSYEAGDTIIDLSSQLASIDAFIINPAEANVVRIEDIDVTGGTTYAAQLVSGILDAGSFTPSGGGNSTSITIKTPAKTQTTKAGTFLAVGRRS